MVLCAKLVGGEIGEGGGGKVESRINKGRQPGMEYISLSIVVQIVWSWKIGGALMCFGQIGQMGELNMALDPSNRQGDMGIS